MAPEEHFRKSDEDIAEINRRIAQIENDLREIIEIYRNAKGAVWVFKWLTIITATVVSAWQWFGSHFIVKA
jgi:type II secretory pathway component PulJ